MHCKGVSPFCEQVELNHRLKQYLVPVIIPATRSSNDKGPMFAFGRRHKRKAKEKQFCQHFLL